MSAGSHMEVSPELLSARLAEAEAKLTVATLRRELLERGAAPEGGEAKNGGGLERGGVPDGGVEQNGGVQLEESAAESNTEDFEKDWIELAVAAVRANKQQFKKRKHVKVVGAGEICNYYALERKAGRNAPPEKGWSLRCVERKLASWSGDRSVERAKRTRTPPPPMSPEEQQDNSQRLEVTGRMQGWM